MSAKIYCIECLETGEKYIGSTKEKYLSDRISGHRCDAKNKSCSSKQIIERDKYKYYLIEEVELSQRYIREQYHMDNTDKCINKRSAYGLNRKEYYKQYNQLNKDKQKEYYKFKRSWGGYKRRNNNLLEIDLSLFLD